MATKFNRNILFDYLQNKYSITKMPKQLFIKLSNIFNGKLQGLNKPIPPEHMYDMWQRKSSYLDKVHASNIIKGKKMEGYIRLNYDLAIIISKYDDYLAWLDRQKSLAVDNEKLKENVEVTKVLYKQNIQPSKQDNNDIADIIDELI
jgi:hypothetical protein